MEKLDRVVADHIEHRLLQPKRLEEILSSVLDRREERAERRTAHIAELRKRAAEADAKLKRLYDAIENGVADLSDPMLKDRVAELKAIRDQARADAERAEAAIERLGPTVPDSSHARRSPSAPQKPAALCQKRRRRRRRRRLSVSPLSGSRLMMVSSNSAACDRGGAPCCFLVIVASHPLHRLDRRLAGGAVSGCAGR